MARPQNQTLAAGERTNMMASESSWMRRSAQRFLFVNSNVVGDEEDMRVGATKHATECMTSSTRNPGLIPGHPGTHTQNLR